ncbi:MAG: spore germination protein [Bacillota bacterium]|nr:spore germination protein [Bacillota bacterium]
MFRQLKKPLKPGVLKMRRQEEQLARLQPAPEVLAQPLTPDLETNLRRFKELFGEASDLVTREFCLGTRQEIRVVLIFIDGLVDKGAVSEAVLKPFFFRSLGEDRSKILPGNAFEFIRNHLVTAADVKEADHLGDVLDLVLAGNLTLFIEGSEKALLLDTKGWKDRAVSEPEAECFIRGPRDGFIETLRTNTALVRRRIKTPRLRCKTYPVGRLTKTDVCVMYVDGLANPATVEEVARRIQAIDTDGILESGYIEDFIKDNYRTPFVLTDRTERPDKVAGALLEGRVAILVDGTPFALVVPAFFSGFLQSAEDYYEGMEFIRPFRWAALLLALTLPSLYVALTSFHQEMIPSSLALSIAAGREGVPFPASVEAFMMEATFDFLREAGIRMPRPVGQAVGIVGAIVLGEAAVTAGVVSPFMVIVVALTAIVSFLIPNFSASLAIRILRYPLLFLAGAFGLVGVAWGLMFLLLHLTSLRSFGVPYFYPLAPAVPGDWGDVFIRVPWWAMERRPRLLRAPDPIRQAPEQRPEPPPVRPRRGPGADREGAQ